MFWKRKKKDEIEFEPGWHVQIVLMYLIQEHWDERTFEVSRDRGLGILKRRMVEADAPSPEEAWDKMLALVQKIAGEDGMQLSITRGGHSTREYSVALSDVGVRFRRLP